MGSSGATPEKEKAGEEVNVEVAGIVKRLVRTIAYTFYEPCHIAIFNVLLKHIVVDEDSLSLLLRIDKKQLRSMINVLKNNKLIRFKVVKERVEETGQLFAFTFYYINYHVLVNVLKYKLEFVKRKIGQAQENDAKHASYSCTNCEKTFTDLDIGRLINLETGDLTCCFCSEKVIENEDSKKQIQSRTLLAKFNQQFSYLYKLLDRCFGVRFDSNLVEPTVSRFQLNRALNSRNSFGNIVEMFNTRSHRSKLKKAVVNPFQQQVSIKFDEDQNLVNEEKVAKELPSWLENKDDILKRELKLQTIKDLQNNDGDDIDNLLKNEFELNDSSSVPSVKSESFLNIESSIKKEELQQKSETFVCDSVKEELIENANSPNGAEDDNDLLVKVDGLEYHIRDINDDLIEKMTDSERDHYLELLNMLM